MREILFRAKRIDTGEWVEGSFIDSGNHEQVFIYPHFGGASIMPCRSLVYHRMIAVDAETLCQFTGLYDKNGNKIWENDIVKMTYRENYFENGVVRYYEQDVRYRFCTESDSFSFDNTDTFEVIGNIFDNPELLEGGAE